MTSQPKGRAARPRRLSRYVVATTVVGFVSGPVPATASGSGTPILREADVHVTFLDAGTCRVSMDVAWSGASDTVEHLLGTVPADVVSSIEIVLESGAQATATNGSSAARVGPDGSRVLEVPTGGRPDGRYRLTYRLARHASRRHECALWLPRLETDGGTPSVRVRVSLPEGSRPLPDAFPALRWSAGPVGDARLAHLPALVRAPYSAAGDEPGWWQRTGWRRLTDAVTVLLLMAASAGWWTWSRRR